MPERQWSAFPSHLCGALRDVTAVLPLAATEQHGPHLPMSTDTDIMKGLLDLVCARAPADLDFRILPIVSIGSSEEHGNVPGTLSLSPTTLLGAIDAIAENLARAGIRKVLLITSHGGNEHVMGIAALTMRSRFQMLAVKTSWQRFGVPEGLYGDEELKLGIHGGDYETSLMVHFRPDLVDLTAAREFSSLTKQMRQNFTHLSPQSPHGFAWLATDLNPAGVVGRADLATAEKGRQTALFQADGLIALLADLQRADPATILSEG